MLAQESSTVFADILANDPSFVWNGTDDFARICCPFHNDSNPSCYVNVHTGAHGCFSCAYQKELGWHWDVLAEKMGWPTSRSNKIKKYRNSVATFTYKIARFNKNASRDCIDPRDIDPTLKFYELKDFEGKKWRGIKYRVLHRFNVREGMDDGIRRLVMPVEVNRTVHGYVKPAKYPHDLPEDIVKSKNSPGDWVKTFGLFGFDQAKQLKRFTTDETVVLVEGPRDCLRLQQYGVPAIAILGTNLWNKSKLSILKTLMPSTILIMMDRDDAGMQAAERIEASIKAEGLTVYNRTLGVPPGKDPADMKKSDILYAYEMDRRLYPDGHSGVMIHRSDRD